jgi:transcription initiation factor TFIIIB Brf1 subunit/transcription initiation factor TFIIB
MLKTGDINNTCRKNHSFTLTDPTAEEVICIDCGTVVSERALDMPREARIHK